MEINKEIFISNLLYNDSIKYSENITLYPVTMKDIIPFQFLQQSIIVRKNSVFRSKKIIKMSYLDFLFYCMGNTEIESQYNIKGLSKYYFYAMQLILLCCRESHIKLVENSGNFYINDELITPQVFDDLRRIIIIQNDIDFDIDEFLNYDTEQRLLKAQRDINKERNKPNIEDYIDSLIIALNTDEEHIKNMTIRKFWRYLRRYNLHESYVIAKTGECSGMVKYKEPIGHWITSLDEDDKYQKLKTNETELRSKIG